MVTYSFIDLIKSALDNKCPHHPNSNVKIYTYNYNRKDFLEVSWDCSSNNEHTFIRAEFNPLSTNFKIRPFSNKLIMTDYVQINLDQNQNICSAILKSSMKNNSHEYSISAKEKLLIKTFLNKCKIAMIFE